MEDSDLELTTNFLRSAANALSTTCPAASRYYMSIVRHLGSQPKSATQCCEHCGSLWTHLNHKVRIHPISPANRHIKKLLKWEKEQPWKLNNQQKRKLKKFREATNKIIYTCSVCKKSTSFPGLKKYTAKEQDISFNTPVPKINLKKGDLNAGLFIPTPIENQIENKLSCTVAEPNSEAKRSCTEAEPGSETKRTKINPENENEVLSTPKLVCSNNGSKTTERTLFTLNALHKNKLPQTSSSKKKKRKGLLTQILNQEKETKLQKRSLSSFLTSL